MEPSPRVPAGVVDPDAQAVCDAVKDGGGIVI